MQLTVVVGIRSQIVKLAGLQLAVAQADRRLWQPRYVNAGQHYDEELAGQYLRGLDVQIDTDLTPRLTRVDSVGRTAEMLAAIHTDLTTNDNEDETVPVMVFGDANATLAAALAASKAGRPVVHVEAGVRLGTLKSSEEINRVVADRVATLHLASSRRDEANLVREGYGASTVFTGDVVRDLVARLDGGLSPRFRGFEPGAYVLLTLHRAETLSDRAGLIRTVNAVAREAAHVLFVTHPRTRQVLRDDQACPCNVTILAGLPYVDMLEAIKGCAYVVTDSGALQREAYYLRKRCVVRQDVPFWPTLTEAGTNLAVSNEPSEITRGMRWAQANAGQVVEVDDFGHADAGDRILQATARLAV